MRLRCFAIALACIAACSACFGFTQGNPVVPAETLASVAGQWSGSLESSNYPSRPVSMTLSQMTRDVAGTWAEQPSGSGGSVTGNVDTAGIVGTITFRINQSATCSGRFSGPATGTPSTLTLTMAEGFTGNCNLPGDNPQAVRFVLQRR
jgi:hypothetical protein